MSDLILEVVEGQQAGRQVPLGQVVDIGREFREYLRQLKIEI